MILVKTTCDHCGKEYELQPSHLKRSKHHYCSKRCMGDARSTSILVKCENCGKEIYKTPSEIKHRKHLFCSNECRWTLYKSDEMKEQRRARWANPDFKKKMSEVRLRQFSNPETLRKMSESHKGQVCTDDRKEKLREMFKDREFTEEWRRKISISKKGSLNPMWKGGYYPKRYCFRFNKVLKDEIRSNYNYTCYECNKVQRSPGLSIHHIDYNYNAGCNNMKFALLPLCNSCHGKTNFNRWFWFNKYISYWAKPYLDFDKMMVVHNF